MMTRERRSIVEWLPMASGVVSSAVICGMVWAALLTPSARLPQPPGPRPEQAIARAALDGLRLCHETAASEETCRREVTPRAEAVARRAPEASVQLGRLTQLRVIRVRPALARPCEAAAQRHDENTRPKALHVWLRTVRPRS